MSLYEPRCMVCGAPLDIGAPFEKDAQKSETCSDKCADIYFHNEDVYDDVARLAAELEACKKELAGLRRLVGTARHAYSEWDGGSHMEAITAMEQLKQALNELEADK